MYRINTTVQDTLVHHAYLLNLIGFHVVFKIHLRRSNKIFNLVLKNLNCTEGLLETSTTTDRVWSLASSIIFRKSSLDCMSLFFFSFLSSSARVFTYWSNTCRVNGDEFTNLPASAHSGKPATPQMALTCFRSLGLSSKYRGSNTILCSSLSQVEKAETCGYEVDKKNYSPINNLSNGCY